MPLGRLRQGRPVETKDFVDYQTDAENIKGLRQLGQKRELDMQQQEIILQDQEQQRADQEAFGALFEKYDGDIDAAWGEMLGINHEMAFSIRAKEDEARMNQGRSLRQHLENDLEMRRQTAMILDDDAIMQDPEAWERARSAIGQVDPEAAESMPQMPDQAWVDQTVGASMTEREVLENEMQGLTEIMGDEPGRGYPRWLSRARDPEEYAGYVETARAMGVPKPIMDMYPSSMPLNEDGSPDLEFMQQLREAGMTPGDLGAMDRARMQREYQEEYLEVQREANRINEERYLNGDDNALAAMSSTNPRANLMNMAIRRAAINNPEGGPGFYSEVQSELARIQAMPGMGAGTGDEDLDPIAVRAGTEPVATYIQENARPQPPEPDAPQEEWADFEAQEAQWQEGLSRAQQAGDVIAGRTSAADVGRPYQGGRESPFEGQDPAMIEEVREILRANNMPADDSNVQMFLDKYGEPGAPGAPEAEAGSIGSLGGRNITPSGRNLPARLRRQRFVGPPEPARAPGGGSRARRTQEDQRGRTSTSTGSGRNRTGRSR